MKLNRTVSTLFGRHKGFEELDRIRALLEKFGRIYVTKKRPEKASKPTERWHAAQ
jgi:hypothetical protein